MDGDLNDQIRQLLGQNATSMDRIAKLNTAQMELTITKIENNLVKQLNYNNKQINDKMAKNNEQIKDQIKEKIDGIQKMVVGLTETIKTVESKVSKNETEIVVVKENCHKMNNKF